MLSYSYGSNTSCHILTSISALLKVRHLMYSLENLRIRSCRIQDLEYTKTVFSTNNTKKGLKRILTALMDKIRLIDWMQHLGTQLLISPKTSMSSPSLYQRLHLRIKICSWPKRTMTYSSTNWRTRIGIKSDLSLPVEFALLKKWLISWGASRS